MLHRPVELARLFGRYDLVGVACDLNMRKKSPIVLSVVALILAAPLPMAAHAPVNSEFANSKWAAACPR